MKLLSLKYTTVSPLGHLKVFASIRIWICIVCLAGQVGTGNLRAQNYDAHRKYAVINFEDGTATDTMGNIEADLLNGAWVSDDADRGGKVARFSSATRASLRLLTSPLNDTMTLSFWFKRQDGEPTDPWRMIFAFIADDGSDLYLTPRTTWNDKLYLISDNKPFGIYTGIPSAPVENQKWSHYTVVFAGNYVEVYQDGELTGERTLIHTLSELRATKWYFINNPVKNFPMSGRLDDLVIYHSKLEKNQVSALYAGQPVPEPQAYDPAEIAGEVSLIGDYSSREQMIRHFASSDGWNTQPVGLYFSEAKKEELARMLFSTEMKEDGSPEGIGLSGWRFNIGAGTFEQGEESRIASESRRTECFLQEDGTYDWTRQAGQRWFLDQAALTYGVEDIIGWQNSPPVQFTKRGLGFREYGDPMETILAADKYDDFGDFLAEVALRFKAAGIAFDYISPLNEPQYGWAPDEPGGLVKQEGTPWTNQNISDVVKAIDQSFTTNGVEAQLILTEAGSYNALLGGTGTASNQLYALFHSKSAMYIGDLSSVSNAVCAHSYWTDRSAQELVNKRKEISSTLLGGYPDLELFQSEYSLLGSGYTFGHPDDDLSPMEAAISLARVIHSDLAYGNVTGWSWWSTFGLEQFQKNYDTDRFGLVRFALNSDSTAALYRTTKLLYALGHYSRFIRPGMQRINVDRSDQLSDIASINELMASAYVDEARGEVVYVAVNASRLAREVRLQMENLPDVQVVSSWTPYVTSGFQGDELKRYPSFTAGESFIVPPLSMVTFTGELTEHQENPVRLPVPSMFHVYPNPSRGLVHLTFDGTIVPGSPRTIRIADYTGKIVYKSTLPADLQDLDVNMNQLVPGYYIFMVESEGILQWEKVIILR